MTDRKPNRDYGFVKRKPQSEVDDELHFHLEQRIKANIEKGMSPDDARKAALERFGNVNGVRDECAQLLTEDRKAEARRDWLDDLRQDVRFAGRAAVRAPVFSLLAIVTLALGIGANAAVFGVVKSVLLDALPYARSGELMRLYCPWRGTPNQKGALSVGTMSDVRERQRSFTSLGAFMGARDAVYLSEGASTPQMVKSMWIEPQLLRTLGVLPIRGPGFRDEDALHDTTTVVMISYGAWQRLFAGEPSAVGKTIRLNGIPRTIVGVLPRSFVPPEEPSDFFQPMGLALQMGNPVTVRGSHNLGVIARRKPGTTEASARREMNAIGAELERLYAKDNTGIELTAVSLRDAMVGDTRGPLLVLLASAALVLLITCANLAGALLSRAISRRKEFAVRVALGAGRGRLARQLLTESVLLAALGGAAGLALAMGGLSLLRGLALNVIPSYANLSLDTGAIVVTFALALATGIAFGIGPAMSVGRADPQRTLRDETRGTSESVRSRRMRGVLVAGQIALCVSLLAAAGLLVRSLIAMTSAPIGFDPDHVLTFTVQPPNATYGSVEARNQLYDRAFERLNALPGVSAAAVVSGLPTQIQSSNGLFIQDAPWASDQPVPFILTMSASEQYFKALSVPLVQGRTFTPDDRPAMPPVIVINDAMAKKYWPKGNAVGARIHIGPPDPKAPWITVVGIVGNVRNDPTHLAPDPMMYLPFRQESWGNTLVIRASGDPAALTNSARAALASIDPMIPMFKVATMNEVLGDTFATRRLPVVLMTSFGALALLLASVGVYAMFANMAAAREREFGVRVALGSSPGAIAGLVLRQGGAWLALGLAIGTGGVVMAANMLRTQLFGVPQFDPVAIGTAVLVLLVCAGVALLVPVRRATRVDPISVMR
ncbi:MAG TPA: ABC transporter permease [Gemmatimonadaceae bacterium]|nr:ABC transporter permease [Gemmatimonadaceae bacterium]